MGGVAVLALVAAAVPFSEDALPPLEFAKGFFEGGGDWLPGAVEAPELSILVAVPLGLALDASALGEWLRERAGLRRIALRLGLLIATAWVAVLVLGVAVWALLRAGVPAWSLAAVAATAGLATLVVLGAEQILGSNRASPPFPWEPPAPVRLRRLFTGRQPVLVVLLLVVTVLLALAGWGIRRAPVPASSTRAEADRFILVTEVIGWCVLVSAVAVYLVARRRAALTATEVLAQDARKPILYLRSFDDDKLRVWAHGSPRRSLVERMLGRRKERFEVVLGWHLWGLGPVVAVGRPSERLPPLGAAREYLDDDRWQVEVESRIESARAVTLVLGRTAGLVWELQAIDRLHATDRLLLVVPPVLLDEENRRWEAFQQAASQMGWPVPDPITRSRMLVGAVDGDRSWLAVVGGRRDEYHYEVALEAGVELLEARNRGYDRQQ